MGLLHGGYDNVALPGSRVDDHVRVAQRDGYLLIDAGDGRRLEQFGEHIVDRPAPMALEPRQIHTAWERANLRFDRYRGWSGPGATDADPPPWILDESGLRLELRATESGQVGFFPEQEGFWAWFHDRIAEHPGGAILNLFAYTGATTLAIAREGAEVVHVDASRPAVAWARRNAELSGLSDRPVRWIVDDAEGFVRRETRRGRRYDGIVLDPPSYGHPPTGRGQRLDERLDSLLDACAAAATDDAFLLMTTHTPNLDAGTLADLVNDRFGGRAVESGALDLTAESGAVLSLGAYARIIRR
jgi:23S rRNA (cytosine1962-C5)-methyltransferase